VILAASVFEIYHVEINRHRQTVVKILPLLQPSAWVITVLVSYYYRKTELESITLHKVK